MQRTATLTEDGIGIEKLLVDVTDLREQHGDSVHEDDDCVIFADGHGHELNEFADDMDVSRDELVDAMHEQARGRCDYDWSVSDPVVIAK